MWSIILLCAASTAFAQHVLPFGARLVDIKNKRGISDYPLSFTSLSPFQSPPSPSGISSFAGQVPSFAGHQLASFGHLRLPLNGGSNFVSEYPSGHGIGSFGGAAGSINFAPGVLNLPSTAGLSIATLGAHHSPGDIGALAVEKNGPVTFGGQYSNAVATQSYVPVYATASGGLQGPSQYTSPIDLGSLQASSSYPSSPFSGLSSGHGFSLSPPAALTYNVPAGSDTASNTVTGSYIVGANSQTAASYLHPSSTLGLTLSASSPQYITEPASEMMNYHHQVRSSGNPPSSTYVKYAPVSSEGNNYNFQTVSYSNPYKISAAQTNPALYNQNLYKASDSKNAPVNSYGSPTLSYSNPENYNPSVSYSGQTYSNSESTYNTMASSTPRYSSSVTSSPNSASASSMGNYKTIPESYTGQSTPSPVSNSVDNNYSADSADSSSSPSFRYLRVPQQFRSSSSSPSSYQRVTRDNLNTYDTISYSVPSEKY